METVELQPIDCFGFEHRREKNQNMARLKKSHSTLIGVILSSPEKAIYTRRFIVVRRK
jgi:hypothetical protein